MSLVLRLAMGSGRGAVARQLLVVLGTALASALLLVATGLGELTNAVLGAGCSGTAYSGRAVISDVCNDGPITSEYLVQPGLRHGVVSGFVLCVVPLLVFLATASRVAARQRDQRLAGLRLAGATQSQVRALAMIDTGLGAAAGALLGSLLFVIGRAVILAVSTGQVHVIASVATPHLWVGLCVLVALVVAVLLGAALTLRAVAITPLGVFRRVPRRHPRPWGVVLLLAGLILMAVLASTSLTTGIWAGAVAVCLAAAMLGLVTSGTWITSRLGRAVGRRANGPVLLLAGRRLEDEPRAQARAMSAVVLVVLAATVALVVLQDFIDNNADDDFYVVGFTFAGIGMVFSLIVASAGLLLTTAEALLERRRTLAALTAGGVSRETLQRAVLAQVALPMVPASVLAVLTGIAVMGALYGSELAFGRTLWFALLLPPAAVMASVSAAAVTLPLLRSEPVVEQLRVP